MKLSKAMVNKMTPSVLEICDSTQWFRSIMPIQLAKAIYVNPENRKVTLSLSLSFTQLLLTLPFALSQKAEKVIRSADPKKVN